MTPLDLFALSLALLAYAAVSARAARGLVTAPMAFAGFGLAVGGTGLGLMDLSVSNAFLNRLAEITLALVLFTDASKIDLRRITRQHELPIRLLGIGLPLTVAFGFALALVAIPELSVPGALLLAIALAPTDAALGQAVMTNAAVPARIRQALNVESGLNDGLAYPALVIAATLAVAGAPEDAGGWAGFVGAQILLGPAAGIAIGLAGAAAFSRSAAAGWTDDTYLRLAALGLALAAYAGAETVGGNGFLAAFACGMTVGARATALRRPIDAFAETEGQLLNLTVFALFGAVLVPAILLEAESRLIEAFVWRDLLYAALSLTVIRMVPVALCLLGAGLRMPTVLFLGWFGPRGLASIIYLLILIDDYALAEAGRIAPVVLLTVALSIVLHGVTAAPLARRYGRAARRWTHARETAPAAALRPEG